ncbi:MAG: alpha/beta fold hydrolase [Flavobacteriales bacterium]|nr:alpha/beta fold hydrolase [Flavobacteriales bacterium]
MKRLLVFLVVLTTTFNAMATINIVNKEVNGFTFKCRVAGDTSGEPVILLHGFPETSHMWIPLMERLSENGYYCIAPDQRGYSPQARPTDVKAYEIEELVSDVVGLADAFGFEKFQLIGHDWGSAVGWGVVAYHPDRVKSWTALSVPHLKAFSDAVRFDKKQKKMSQYMGFFQLRGIPEWFMLRKDRKMLKGTWRSSSEEEKLDYLDVIGNKPGLKAALAWYRANYKVLKKGQKMDNYLEVKTPTLLLWGKKDFAIGPVGVEGTAQYMKGEYKRVDLDASHWLIQEDFEGCAVPILEHLNSHK